ncbi:putative ATP-binding cassette protein subfamily A, member 7 [Leishmania major strain Friedlin]|uniref:Putative ATP-binding cassette protein subfamily A, member 7 n=1 Tax=Leishmania major TaxID=5664 RepID=Q4QFA9_LEIMA|nr:putative ATP-binding cassette protein subfamily A, member 7 [Leishmania major strain Friedlin]CAG9571438.1 ATP-binding_cassette_subfamily_A_-_member_1_-_putative [Leishmania major strain Friedlin]CAJ03300.1 putative ATP-binding cassette protein subfamily A, member 7 [Leishmania major strain Friedlin]|eukprot:XP_001681989.1 putative ATP-binding cassette protein subfamily A, member 7 [Leishmania major strain Friedlin]
MQPTSKGSRDAATRQSDGGAKTGAVAVAAASPEAPPSPPLHSYVFPTAQELVSPAAPFSSSKSEDVLKAETPNPVAAAARQPPAAAERRASRVRFLLALEPLSEPRSAELSDGLWNRADGDPVSLGHSNELHGTLSVSAAQLEPYSVITKTGGVQMSRWTQVLALLQRTGQQYMRQKLLIITEVVSPLLFVVLLIILNVAFGTNSIPETVFTAPIMYSYQLNLHDYMTYICYNDTTRPINGLHSCADLNFSYSCDGDESEIPVYGLCYFCGFEKPATVVKHYLNSLMGIIISLPSLDSIIVHQWMAKKAGLAKDSRSRTALAALSNIGIGLSATTRFDSISYSGLLYFAPAANTPAALIEYFHKHCAMFEYVYGGVFDTVEEAHAAIKANGSDEALNSTWGLIIVNDITDGFDVQVQLHSSALPSLSPPTVSLEFRGGFTYDGTDMFLASGFLSLQQMLYTYFYVSRAEAGALANLHSGAVSPYTLKEIYPVIVSYPTIAAHTPYLLSLSPSLVALVMVMSLLYPFAQVTKRVVLEKELCIQESVCIMGLRRSSLWLNFLLVIFFEYVLISILLTVLLCAVVAPRSNPFAVFIILFVYSLTLIPLCGLVSAFLSRARMATLVSPLIYFVLSVPIFVMGTANRSIVIGLSLLSPAALASLLTDVFIVEAGGGFQMHHFHSPYFSAEPYLIMLILACDCILYLLLMIYLNAVLPQEWGTRKHPLFFIIEPWVWLKGTCGSCRRDAQRESASEPAPEPTRTTTTLDVVRPTKERPESGAATATSQKQQRPSALAFDPRISRDASTDDEKVIGVRISHLCKYFQRNGKRFAAVDNVSWNMYRGEIAVLLGPNGAGKSTTINMITGMLAADSGDCFIEGHSITQNVAEARHEIGYCPQHNILWPDLTCREHLEFYGKIKGLRGAELEDAVVDILRAVDLEEKVDAIPAQMSGGQKRKLSVAIAFVGRNRVVLLDEPTAGMDAAARRHTWSLLRAMAQHHTIMLTTHSMDEADLLGDNIAIVTEGVLQCAGSTAFLRQYAGVGYTLRFDLTPVPTQEDGDAARQAKVAAVWAELHQLVMSHLPDSMLVLQTDAEVEYELRLGTDARLPEFLKDMESRGNRQLRIRGYALRAPTLEDVFMRVVEHQIAPSSQVAVVRAADEAAAREQVSGEKDGGRTCSGPPAAPSSPLVHRFVNRRMSRASLHYLNSESMLNYGNNAEPSNGDEYPMADLAAASPTQPQAPSDVVGARSMASTGPDGGDTDGVHVASVAKNNNASVTGLRQRESRSRSFNYHESADGASSLSAQFPQEVVGSADCCAAANRPLAGPAPSVRRTTTAALTAQQHHHQGSTTTAVSSSDIPGVATVAARVHRPDRAPCPPLSEAMVSESTAQTSAAPVPVPVPATTTTAAAAAAAGTNPSVRSEAFLYKLVTDHHLTNVWQSRQTSQRWCLWGLQLRGMMYKRFFCAIRDPRMHFFQIVCPILCILLAMLLQLVEGGNEGTLYLSPSVFDVESAMQVSGCTKYMGDVAHMHEYGHNFSKVSFSDPNFVSSTDMSNELLDTWFTHSRNRFMSLQCGDPDLQLYLTFFYQDVIGTRQVNTLLYNTSSRNSLPIAMHMMYAIAYFGALGTSADAAAATYTMSLTGLPQDAKATQATSAISSILIGTIFLIPFTFLPANPVAWVAKEYESRARHLQTASGLLYLVYWIGNFLFDFTAYVVSMIFIVVTFLIFQRWEYVGGETIGATIASFSTYGVCYCWCSYMVSFAFTEHTTAQIVVLGVSFLTGFLCVILVFVLSLLEKTLSASNTLRWVFRLLPPYSIGEVILNLALLEQKMTDPSLTAWSMSVTGWPDIYMAVEAPIFAAITLLWDHPNRRAVIDQLSVGWGAWWCRCCGGSRCWRHRTQRADQRGRWAPMPDAAAVTVDDTSATPVSAAVASPRAPPPNAVSPILRSHDNDSPAIGATETAEVAAAGTSVLVQNASLRAKVIAPDPHRSPHKEWAEEPVASNATPLPMSPISAVDANLGGGVVGLTGPTLMGVTGAPQSQEQLMSGRSVSNRANSATLPDMVYPPPRWCKAEVLRRRKEEDSDVEEERGAVYQAERQHLAEQTALSIRAASSRRHSRQLTGSDSGEKCQQETEPTVASCDAVRLVDLRKVYRAPRKVAVSALTLSIMHGEVFGFLGTNGAGKSSALSIITQEQLPTSGRAYVCGNDVVRESRRAARCLGYCPQFDACLDLLTVTEHLHLYAMVRGVPVGQLESLVTSLLTICNLTQYRHASARQLSGGNRRKLSVAIALIGAPKVLCLDEPTSGMDPLARQLLWRAIDRISRKCCVILTTHHLGEVEALADCVGIMVDGGLRCLGDMPHLKHKYASNAYELTLRVSPGARRCAQKRREEQRQRAAAGAGVSSVADSQRSNASTAHGLSNNSQGSTINSALGRRMSTSYAGNDLIDTSDDIFQFMLKTFPSALLIEVFNDERYIYTLPATRDVADAMQQLLQQQQKRSRRSIQLVQTPLVSAKNYVGQHSATNAAEKSPPIVRLSEVFETLRAAQAELGITEYSVSQVSLEQVFLRVCSAEETLDQDRRHNRASAASPTSQSTTFVVNSNTCSGVTPHGHLLQRRGSRASFIARSPAAAMIDSGASPSRRRLSMPSYGGLPGGTAAPRVTFPEYRRLRALWRLRTEAAELHLTTSKQQRVAQPDHESTP